MKRKIKQTICGIFHRSASFKKTYTENENDDDHNFIDRIIKYGVGVGTKEDADRQGNICL
jgi:hypothetical protein